MGTKERQQRDRDRLQQSILTAARELFVAEGYRNVSMRKIADRIEDSPAAIYSYFPSKDDIFFALAEEGFRTTRAASARRHPERRRSARTSPARSVGVLRVLEDEPRVFRSDVHRPFGAEPHARTSSGSSSSRRRLHAPRPTFTPASTAGNSHGASTLRRRSMFCGLACWALRPLALPNASRRVKTPTRWPGTSWNR